MSLPIKQTTIKVMRPVLAPDYDTVDNPSEYAVVASGIAAVISSPTGQAIVAGGGQEIVRYRLNCDPVEIEPTDQIEDETTGVIYDVEWSRPRRGFGSIHPYTQADLKQISGIAAGPNA
jgi:hypothetical protein